MAKKRSLYYTVPELVYQRVVYRIYDVQDELIYVGVTRNLYERITDHRKETPWYYENCFKIIYDVFENWTNARNNETTLINKYQPRYNILGTDRYRGSNAYKKQNGAAK